MNNGKYRLSELAKIDIDLWVKAVSDIYDDPVAFRRIIEIASDDEIRKWLDYDRCPAELECAILKYVNEKDLVFDETGTIV